MVSPTKKGPPPEFIAAVEKIEYWIHDHPLTMKVAKIALLALGIGLGCATPFAVLLPVGLAAKICIIGAGSLIALTACVIGTVAHIFLDIAISPHHDMKNHAYKPSQCEGGKLYYDGDVPILALEADNPYIAGKAHGYLCGDAINSLVKRYEFAMYRLGGKPRADQLEPLCLDRIRSHIPKEYLTEMQGLLEGYNQWAKENWWKFPKKMSLDDIMYMHLMPDSLHFQPESAQAKSPSKVTSPSTATTVACTAIVDSTENEGLKFARNMDWMSFGLAGTKSLVVNRRFKDHRNNTVEVNVPGFIGATTGQNSKGLSVAMNVCSGNTKEINGMPACFYNRYCLENFGNVAEVETFAKSKSPLGAYHLTAADPNKASSIHFFQASNGNNVVRRWEKDKPLVTLNFRYNPTTDSDVHHSSERLREITEHFKKKAPLEDALALPYVNNSLTTHRVEMTPKTRTFKVAFDNAFAGKVDLHNVATAPLFA